MADPFSTAALRAAVLDAWAASPTRFREDANAEEDLRLGGYADTWFVELAQNAADAAGGEGRLRVTVVGDGELRVANTGTALTAEGVAALASLRASAKRDDNGAVGRFGVGFAAVLSVSDAPRVVSTPGAVAFSAARTAEAVAAFPGPTAELARRDAPPVLRLVWPSDEQPPAGFATEVRLPLRDGRDGAALLAHARAAAPDLLLALPALAEIDVDGHVVRRAEAEGVVTVGARRWRIVRRTGVHGALDAAVEQRDRREWAVTWALPLDGALGDDVAHAPTATAEALTLPARLIATLPLEPDRRRVRPGPTADAVLDGAAAAYVDLVRSVEPAQRLALVPEPGFPRSPLDGQLRARVVAALRAATWLPAAGPGEARDAEEAGPVLQQGHPAATGVEVGPALQQGHPAATGLEQGHPAATGSLPAHPAAAGSPPPHPTPPRELAPGRAEWLDIPGVDARLPALLAAAGFDRLVAPPYLPAALIELGARRLPAAELVERLFGVEQPPSWWRAVYAELAELADTVPGLIDDLRALPVPLVDGRAAAGPATVLLPDVSAASGELVDLPASARSAVLDGSLAFDAATASAAVDVSTALAGLALPGLHVAHPDALHPLLTRLGATPADPAVLLDHPAVRAAVERSLDDAEAGLDPAPLAEAVLALVQAAGAVPEALAALALPDVDGLPGRADELMLPDAALRPLLADDVPLRVLDPRWAVRFPRAALTAVGVVDGFALVVDEEPVGPDHELDDEDRWWDSLAAPPSRFVGVRDLDLVDDAAWPHALALLGADRATREATTSGYTAWWLARHARLGGRRPGYWRLPAAVGLAALYDPLPVPGESTTSPVLDDALLVAIGVRRDLHIADARSADDLLARLADPDRHPSTALVARAHIALAEAVADDRVDAADLDLPEHVRAMDGSVAHVDVAAVLDAPWPAAVLPAAELVIGGDPVALAELLDLPLATDIVAGEIEGTGEPVAWAELGEIVVACHTLGVDIPEGGLRRHGELWVDLRRPSAGRHRAAVWRDRSGAWHAEDPLRALLALLAD